MRSYPKIFNLGHNAISELLLDDVLVEEKIDGSQFSFGVYEGELKCKSKSVIFDNLEGGYANMFELAVQTIKELKPLLNEGWTYRAEFLNKEKHNVLNYSRMPKKNLIIFDIDNGFEAYMPYIDKKNEADRLGLECVPLLFYGKVDNFESFKDLLEKDSILGGVKIEGVVIKNYSRYGSDKKVLMAKYVSEKFKERHNKEWKVTTKKDILQEIGDSLRSEARWQKAIQHLKEKGELENSPRDIGALLKEINIDILSECKDEINKRLFDWGWKKISGMTVRGFPQWYKEKLAEKQFGGDE
jgi:hypothetical protein